MIFGFLANMENTKALYSYSIPWALFPKKLCVAPEFFVLISSHCSTQIWRMRYGGSSSIYFLDVSIVITPYVEIIFGRIIWCLSNLKDCNISQLLRNYTCLCVRAYFSKIVSQGPKNSEGMVLQSKVYLLSSLKLLYVFAGCLKESFSIPSFDNC